MDLEWSRQRGSPHIFSFKMEFLFFFTSLVLHLLLACKFLFDFFSSLFLSTFPTHIYPINICCFLTQSIIWHCFRCWIWFIRALSRISFTTDPLIFWWTGEDLVSWRKSIREYCLLVPHWSHVSQASHLVPVCCFGIGDSFSVLPHNGEGGILSIMWH